MGNRGAVLLFHLEQKGKFSNEEGIWGNRWAGGILGRIATQQNVHSCQKAYFVYDIIHFLYDKKKVKKLLEYHFHGFQIACALVHLSLWCIHPFRIDCRNSFHAKRYLSVRKRERKKKMWIFIFFLKKKVEFNLYLQDTARYEIPHRNKKPICMTNGMEN